MESQRAYKFVQVGVPASSLVSTVQLYLDLGFLDLGHTLYLEHQKTTVLTQFYSIAHCLFTIMDSSKIV